MLFIAYSAQNPLLLIMNHTIRPESGYEVASCLHQFFWLCKNLLPYKVNAMFVNLSVTLKIRFFSSVRINSSVLVLVLNARARSVSNAV